MRHQEKRKARQALRRAVGTFARPNRPLETGVAGFARAIGVARPTAHSWLQRGYASVESVPEIVERVNAVLREKGTGQPLTCHELRPDIYGENDVGPRPKEKAEA